MPLGPLPSVGLGPNSTLGFSPSSGPIQSSDNFSTVFNKNPRNSGDNMSTLVAVLAGALIASLVLWLVSSLSR